MTLDKFQSCGAATPGDFTVCVQLQILSCQLCWQISWMVLCF